jgi:uncharacterized protein with HEPN domain
MSKRNVRLFLEDILEAIEKVKRYTTGMSFEEFEDNELVVDAAEFLISHFSVSCTFSICSASNLRPL